MAENVQLLNLLEMSDVNNTSPSPQGWNPIACICCEDEKWGIPFAIGKSNYIEYHTTSLLRNQQDILEVPLLGNDYSKYAQQIIAILHRPCELKWPNMKWSFDVDINYMNLILYIPESNTMDISIPQAAVPIIGSTFHELIYRTKSWIFTTGDNNPICNIIGEGVLQTSLKQKNLFKGLKKRLELTGLISKYTEDINQSTADKDNSRYPLEPSYCDTLSNSISPFSNLHIILKHCCNDKDMIEKLLYWIGHILKIPTIKLSPEIDGENKLVGFTVDFLDPFRNETGKNTPQFYDIVNIQSELYSVILAKADDFFHRKSDQCNSWNIMPMAIFLNDEERITRAFNSTNFYELDNTQIERIFCYTLFYGSQSLVRAVFEDKYLCTEFRDKYIDIIGWIFGESVNEVYLYNRLMLALRIVDNKEKGRELAEIAIQKLISHDFLWLAPGDLSINVGAGHLLAFFPEYIMLWAVLSQRFEIVELFLEYSGTHRQHCNSDQFHLSTEKGVFQICNALAITCLLNRMAKVFEFDNSVPKKNLDDLIEQSKHFDQLATDLLDYAITREDCSLSTLLYTSSPFWGNKTALELARISYAYKFMNHHAIQNFLSQVWKGHDVIRREKGDNVQIPDLIRQSLESPNSRNSLRVLYHLCTAPRVGFYLYGAFFFFLFIFFFILLTHDNDEDFFHNVQPLEWVMFVCLLGYTIGEIIQYFRFVVLNFKTAGIHKWRIVLKLSFYNYLYSLWNKLDILIMASFIVSFILRLFSLVNPNFPIYIPRLAYGITAIPIFIRSFQHILVVKEIGPLIYTIYQAFFKMLKFLVIILLLSLAVGTLQIALLKSSTSISVRFKHLIFTPLFQIFGEYSFDELLSNTYGLAEFNTSTFSVNTQGVFWGRSDWIIYLVVAIWVLIINVLIINLMIAYFTDIYSEVSEVAKSIYIWQFIEIVDEFKHRFILPPPFNLLFIPYRIVKFGRIYFGYHKKEIVIPNELLRLAKERGLLSKKLDVYFATHNENSFADKFWKSKKVQ